MQILSVITNVILIFKYTDGVVELYSQALFCWLRSAFLLYYTVLRTRQWLCLLGLSLVFLQPAAGRTLRFAFTALTVWGGGLCLAKLDTDAAARRKQPGFAKKKKKKAIKAQTTRRKRACWPVSWL